MEESVDNNNYSIYYDYGGSITCSRWLWPLDLFNDARGTEEVPIKDSYKSARSGCGHQICSTMHVEDVLSNTEEELVEEAS